MVDQRLKGLSSKSRRSFLKLTTAAGAALALDRAKVLDFIADSGGHALADQASCAATNRSVHIVAGDGGFAWFQLLWPHNQIAASGNGDFAFHAFGETTMAGDTDRPMTFAPETPWQHLDAQKRVSAFMAGNNETHTPQPTSAANVSGNGMLAAVASLQRDLASLLPVIGIAPLSFGNAPGAPQVTTVGSADGMVDLFDSAASREILAAQQDADLFEAYYKAFLGLNRLTPCPTVQRQLAITKASANFLGKNLAAQLAPTADDLVRYGIEGGTPNKLRNLAKALITTAKSFALGLTNSVIIPALRDDPHGAFNDMPTLLATVQSLGTILDAFLEDLDVVPDPACTTGSLANNVVVTIHGDTPKNPRQRSGWPDGTPSDSNWLYVMGNGYLKTGWFGGVRADGSVDGFDPTTGNDIPGKPSNQTAAAAAAAVLYAVAKGDMVRVGQFYSGPSIAGITRASIL